MEAIRFLDPEDLRTLSGALRAERLAMPFSPAAVSRLGCPRPAEVAAQLQTLASGGWRSSQIATLLDEIRLERSARSGAGETIDLVWTGPESPAAPSRDTAAVVRDLFGGVERSILVSGFVVYQGREVFETLARRMDEDPEIEATLFLDIPRSRTDTSSESEILLRFAENFRAKEWPGARLPRLYYDPRSLAPAASGKRACLHAKSIVVDRKLAFVSSANLTEAALERNIEVGVLIRSPLFADHLARHFEALVREGALRAIRLG